MTTATADNSPRTGSLSVEEHRQATAARQPEPAPQSVDDHLAALVRKGIKGDPKHRPSHTDPLTRVGAQHKYIPTPSLDPRNISSIENFEAHQGYVQCAVEAFSTIHVALQKLSDARAQVAKDPSKTEAQQVLICATEAEKLQDRATRAFDGARKRLMDGIKAIDDQLSGPLVAKSDNSISAEVRTFFRAMSDDKRHAAIADAVKAKDLTTLQAVLGGPAYLAGLTPERQAHYTRQYRELTTPELVGRLDVMRKAQTLMEQRAGLVFTEVEKALGAKWEVVQELRKSQSAAHAALLLINNPVQQ